MPRASQPLPPTAPAVARRALRHTPVQLFRQRPAAPPALSPCVHSGALQPGGRGAGGGHAADGGARGGPGGGRGGGRRARVRPAGPHAPLLKSTRLTGHLSLPTSVCVPGTHILQATAPQSPLRHMQLECGPTCMRGTPNTRMSRRRRPCFRSSRSTEGLRTLLRAARLRGVALVRTGQPEAALAVLSRGLELDPTDPVSSSLHLSYDPRITTLSITCDRLQRAVRGGVRLGSGVGVPKRSLPFLPCSQALRVAMDEAAAAPAARLEAACLSDSHRDSSSRTGEAQGLVVTAHSDMAAAERGEEDGGVTCAARGPGGERKRGGIELAPQHAAGAGGRVRWPSTTPCDSHACALLQLADHFTRLCATRGSGAPFTLPVPFPCPSVAAIPSSAGVQPRPGGGAAAATLRAAEWPASRGGGGHTRHAQVRE